MKHFDRLKKGQVSENRSQGNESTGHKQNDVLAGQKRTFESIRGSPNQTGLNITEPDKMVIQSPMGNGIGLATLAKLGPKEKKFKGNSPGSAGLLIRSEAFPKSPFKIERAGKEKKFTFHNQ